MDIDRESEAGRLREHVAAVVPCYNAGARLGPVVEGLLPLVEHVLVIDDGSTDGAVAALEGGGARIVVFPENRGKGHAMLAGFRAALDFPEVRHVVIVDADGQHDPGEIAGLYETCLRESADLVVGSRSFDQEQVPWTSWFGNRLTAILTRMVLRQAIPDTQSGFRLHSRGLIEDLLATLQGGRYETEMEILVVAVRKGYRIVAHPIRTIYEEGNPSSHFNRLKDSYRIYRTLFRAALRHRR